MSNKTQAGSKLIQVIWLLQLLTLYTFFLTTNDQSYQLSNLIMKLLIMLTLGLQSFFIRSNRNYKFGIIFTYNQSTIAQIVERLIWFILIVSYFFVFYIFYYK
ncbi:hypothetical protein IGJ19_000549 [Enterococcus sp. DIV1368b]|uniref:Uncharacterized protein n=1 Tax=Enterococcus mundtii TaxID=53346 RepID=A0A242KWY4_ENTMU|nr:hypothetical protein [Enterococcus mundtii]OTP26371.1 hypothetical protein A5802_000082 [Enterococcus mundtii]